MKASVPAAGESAWSWLVGPWDGLLGLWIAIVSGLACAVVAGWPARRRAALARS